MNLHSHTEQGIPLTHELVFCEIMNFFLVCRQLDVPVTLAARSGVLALIARTLGSWVRIPLKA
jgi:hypothetical protein